MAEASVNLYRNPIKTAASKPAFSDRLQPDGGGRAGRPARGSRGTQAPPEGSHRQARRRRLPRTPSLGGLAVTRILRPEDAPGKRRASPVCKGVGAVPHPQTPTPPPFHP